MTPPKRTPPPPTAYFDPIRRMYIQDMPASPMVYPPTLDPSMFNLSMMYQNPGTLLPSYPYLLNYHHPSGEHGLGQVGVDQYNIPTLTSNRNII